jgi:hypothetical protein
MLNPIDFLKNCKITVAKEEFAIVKAKKPLPSSFAVIQDKNEITCIIDQSKLKNDIIEANRGWKILTFEAVLPFELVGFLAAVSKVLAEEKVSIFAISAYSTDHILVKSADLSKAVKALEKLGARAS